MQLRDKIGQMLIIGFDGAKFHENIPIAQSILRDNVGGVILFDYNFQKKSYIKNIIDPIQVKLFNNSLQEFTKYSNTSSSRTQLPLFISVDYEGGKVNRLHHRYGFIDTFTAKQLAKLDLAQIKDNLEMMALTLNKSGFNLNFAPVVDLALNNNNPIIDKLERSFSNDPKIVTSISSLILETYRKYQITGVLKHFPGHGSATSDSHIDFVDVTESWQEEELIPYKNLIPIHQNMMIMSAHIINKHLDPSGLPSTLSTKILKGCLRDKLKYRGPIISDDMQMAAITNFYGLEQGLVKAINAGIDILVYGNQLVKSAIKPHELIDLIEDNVVKGNISLDRIEQAYNYISDFKKRNLGHHQLDPSILL